MSGFNQRLLKEIAQLRNLEDMGIKSARTTYGLEMLRYVRNSELGITFEEGILQENTWIKENG